MANAYTERALRFRVDEYLRYNFSGFRTKLFENLQTHIFQRQKCRPGNGIIVYSKVRLKPRLHDEASSTSQLHRVNKTKAYVELACQASFIV